jgi:hypothetical protein
VGERRAYIVRQDDRKLGYLGEGGGPFLTKVHGRLPYVHYDVARFTSLYPPIERAIERAIDQALDFESLLVWCRAQRFELEAVSYDTVFMPIDRTPESDRSHRGGA